MALLTLAAGPSQAAADVDGRTAPPAADGATAAAPSGSPDRSAPAPQQATEPVSEPGSELRVWLLTVGPGTAIWERFGHNALRVVDTRTGYDVSYNWGIFDFDQEGFIARFLRGRMLYMMAPFATGPMLDMYRSAGREIIAQELDLTPEEKLALQSFAARNALPGNREYFYNYFLDNCSTRVRDLLDLVLGGALLEQFGNEPTGTSYRFHTRRLTRPDPLLFTGMDVLLGSPGDQPITVWEEMFIPMSLRDAVRDVTVGDGRPLVLSEEVLAPPRAAVAPEAPPGWLGRYLLIGTLLGGLMAFGGAAAARDVRPARVLFGVMGAVWGLLTGVAGTILVLVLFTDHSFMTWNENLFVLNPLPLALAVLVPLALSRTAARATASGVAGAVVVLGCLGIAFGLLPFAVQENALEIALLLPGHLGLWLGLEALRGRGPVGRAAPSAAAT